MSFPKIPKRLLRKDSERRFKVTVARGGHGGNRGSLTDGDLSTMVTGFKHLPEKVILRIFGFLPIKSLSQAQLVCKEWKKIGSNPILWKRVVVSREVNNPSKVLAGLLQRFKTQLEQIILERCKRFTDSHVQMLKSAPNLKHVNLSYCELITDRGLPELIAVSNLQSVNLCGCQEITDVGLAVFPHMKKLKALSLTCHSTITNMGMAQLGSCKALEILCLQDCYNIEDDGVNHLCSLPNLKLVEMSHAQITDLSFKHFMECRNLEFLRLDRCSFVSDQGIQQYLCKANKLVGAEFEGCELITAFGKNLMSLTTLLNNQAAVQRLNEMIQDSGSLTTVPINMMR